MNGSVSATINNALKASFTINGATQNIAVIPNGSAYNDAGQDISATLAAQGVTPSQLYSLMSAAYTPPATQTASTTSTAPGSDIMRGDLRINGVARRPGMRGLGVNYVRRGTAF